MSVYPNTGCHAVLALLSEGYPPLEGRSPTRYSPVCHSTHGLLHFRVRLACVRHAASVDSEPGSNSPVKTVSDSRLVNRESKSSYELLLSSRLKTLLKLKKLRVLV